MRRKIKPAPPIKSFELYDNPSLPKHWGDRFRYKYIDPMFPKKQRLLKWLQKVYRCSPMKINWENCPNYNKDLRNLVKKDLLRMQRVHISTHRNKTVLHITKKGIKYVRDNEKNS